MLEMVQNYLLKADKQFNLIFNANKYICLAKVPKGKCKNHECDVSKENHLAVDLKRTKLLRCNLNTGKQKENDSYKYLAVCGA